MCVQNQGCTSLFSLVHLSTCMFDGFKGVVFVPGVIFLWSPSIAVLLDLLLRRKVLETQHFLKLRHADLMTQWSVPFWPFAP